MNFSKMTLTNESQILNSTIEWKYFVFPVIDGHFNFATDLKFVLFPLINVYYLYFLLKLVIKYKAKRWK